MRAFLPASLALLTAAASAQDAPDPGADALQERAQELVEIARNAPRGACDQGVPMPTLDLDRTPAPVPMPETETTGTPAPMPNLCDGPLIGEMRSRVFPLTPEGIDALRDRISPESLERLRESLDRRLEEIPGPYRFEPDALRPGLDDSRLAPLRRRFLFRQRGETIPPASDDALRQPPVAPPANRP